MNAGGEDAGTYRLVRWAGLGHANIDGPSFAAGFRSPRGLAVDESGNLYVADAGNHTVRRISPGRLVTTLAGKPGRRGRRGGLGAAARLDVPGLIATDCEGMVYVACGVPYPDVIYSITPNGLVEPIVSGDVLSGDLASIAVDTQKNLFMAFLRPEVIRKRSPGGVVTTYAGSVAATSPYPAEQGTAYAQPLTGSPAPIATDASGNLYFVTTVVESGGFMNWDKRLMKISPAGAVSSLVKRLQPGVVDPLGTGLSFDGSGTGYLACAQKHSVSKISGDGTVSRVVGGSGGNFSGPGLSVGFTSLDGLTAGTDGCVYLSNAARSEIRVLDPDGYVRAYAGTAMRVTDGPASSAVFDGPSDAAVDSAGNVYVVDRGSGTVRKISAADRVVTTLAGSPDQHAIADGVGSAAGFIQPAGVAVDESGTVYVSEPRRRTIRKVSPAGVVTTWVGSPDQQGSVDGVGAVARFQSPTRLAIDAFGNVYVADQQTIRKVTPAGAVTTLAGSAGQVGYDDGVGSGARFSEILGLCVDAEGTLYVADGAHTIRSVSPTGVVGTLAGAPGEAATVDGVGRMARFSRPLDVAVGEEGNLFVLTEEGIRRINPDGWVTTVAQRDHAGIWTTRGGLGSDLIGHVYVASAATNSIERLYRAGGTIRVAHHPLSCSAGNTDVVVLSAAAADLDARYQWVRNGDDLSGRDQSVLLLRSPGPADSGLYSATITREAASVTTRSAIVGVTTALKVFGQGRELTPTNIRHPNGNVFDQVLLTGAAEAITADFSAKQVTRTSFIDLNDDIVQVEFSGPGTLSLVLENSTDPAPPRNYKQDVDYVKGHAGIVIVGATEDTNLSIFSVGRATAFDSTRGYDITRAPSASNDPAKNGSPLFIGHAATAYDGVADVAYVAVLSANGRFGGIRAANAQCVAWKGHAGIYAPGVEFTGPVFVGDITAHNDATPVIQLGSAQDVRITGGDLLQENGESVEVSGIVQLKFTDGSDSHGRTLPAQSNRAVLVDHGNDVTSRIVVPR